MRNRIKILGVALLLLCSLFVLTACYTNPVFEEDYDDEQDDNSNSIPSLTLSAPEGTLVTGKEYTLSYQLSFGSLDDVIYNLYDNTANAVIEDGVIIAEKSGNVRVEVIGYYEHKELSQSVTLTFVEPNVVLDMTDEEKHIFVGDVIELNYKSIPEDYLVCNSSLITYTVLSGDAEITSDGTTYYFHAKSKGDVLLQLTYKDPQTNQEIVNTEVIRVSSYNLAISAEEGDRIVGQEVLLSATAESIDSFDPASVNYVIQSGDATLNGNKLVANSEGTVEVYGVYQWNGKTVKSDLLTLRFHYGENAIRTLDDLQRLNNSNGSFDLVNDIDLSSVSNWTPITGFSGTLNGHGHKITGLNLTVRTSEENKGFFDVMAGTVSDLTLSGTITSSGEAKYIGLLCGQNNGTVTNVTVSGSIDTPYCSYVGGISGRSSAVAGCTASVSVTAKDYVGGLVGSMEKGASTIENNVNNGEIRGFSYVGGIAGYMTLQGTVEVMDNQNCGSITASSNYAGGIFGYADYAKIMTCENSGDISGKDYVGGIVGSASSHVSEIALCKNQASVTGSSYVGGFAGYANGTTMRSLNNTQTITGKTYVGGIAGRAGKLDTCENNGILMVMGYDLDENNEKISYVGGLAGFATGLVYCTNNSTVDVTDGGKYVGGLVGFLHAARSASQSVEQNINNGEIKGFSYVGGIAGYMTLQGGSNNDTVELKENQNTNSVTAISNYAGGIFGYMSGHHYFADNSNDYFDAHYYAYVKMISCENVGDVNGKDYVGGLVGSAPSYVAEIALCQNQGAVTGSLYVGGFAGYASGTMRSLTNAQTVTGKAYVGGIAGYAGKMESCENNGVLTVTGYELDDKLEKISYVGGLAGYASGIVYCTNNSTVDVTDGGKYVGGLVGYLHATRSSSSPIENNTNNGEVKGASYVGGIAGYMALLDGGNNDTVEVKENENTNSITASGDYVGGIFGYLDGDHYFSDNNNDYFDRHYYAYVKVVSCHNSGDLSGADYVCGLVGACGVYVNTEEAIWDLSTVIGEVNATGTHTDEKYLILG